MLENWALVFISEEPAQAVAEVAFRHVPAGELVRDFECGALRPGWRLERE
jgi:hypothetical protein